MRVLIAEKNQLNHVILIYIRCCYKILRLEHFLVLVLNVSSILFMLLAVLSRRLLLKLNSISVEESFSAGSAIPVLVCTSVLSRVWAIS